MLRRLCWKIFKKYSYVSDFHSKLEGFLIYYLKYEITRDRSQHTIK